MTDCCCSEMSRMVHESVKLAQTGRQFGMSPHHADRTNSVRFTVTLATLSSGNGIGTVTCSQSFEAFYSNRQTDTYMRDMSGTVSRFRVLAGWMKLGPASVVICWTQGGV